MRDLYPLVENAPLPPARAVVDVPLDALFALLMPPEGMRVESIHIEPSKRMVSFIVSHPGIEPTADGNRYPDLLAAYTRLSEPGGGETVEVEWWLPYPSGWKRLPDVDASSKDERFSVHAMSGLHQ